MRYILRFFFQVPLTESELDRLIHMLDKDGDGEVDFA